MKRKINDTRIKQEALRSGFQEYSHDRARQEVISEFAERNGIRKCDGSFDLEKAEELMDEMDRC